MCGIETGQALIARLFLRIFKALILREVECGCDQGIGGKISTQTHCHTHMLHTRTHTSAPSNNPLILFIISQLFLVRAIHERNHTHKHTPMCRAEIQYKYTHLYFLISSSIFAPFCYFSSTLCYASATQLHITIPHQCPASQKYECLLLASVSEEFYKLWRAHFFTPLVAF